MSVVRGDLLFGTLLHHRYLPLQVTEAVVQSVARAHLRVLWSSGMDLARESMLRTPSGLTFLHQVLQYCKIEASHELQCRRFIYGLHHGCIDSVSRAIYFLVLTDCASRFRPSGSRSSRVREHLPINVVLASRQRNSWSVLLRVITRHSRL